MTTLFASLLICFQKTGRHTICAQRPPKSKGQLGIPYDLPNAILQPLPTCFVCRCALGWEKLDGRVCRTAPDSKALTDRFGRAADIRPSILRRNICAADRLRGPIMGRLPLLPCFGAQAIRCLSYVQAARGMGIASSGQPLAEVDNASKQGLPGESGIVCTAAR